MSKPSNASQIDLGFYSSHGPEIVNNFQKFRSNPGQAFTVIDETGKPAKPDNSYFRALVTQSCVALRGGLDCYVFTIEQIKTIQLRMKGFILTVVNLDGIYQLTAERSANNERH